MDNPYFYRSSRSHEKVKLESLDIIEKEKHKKIVPSNQEEQVQLKQKRIHEGRWQFGGY